MYTHYNSECMWVTLCLLPQAVAVNQHLIYISLPDHIWVIITYMGLDRDPLTCSSGKCLLVEKGGDEMIKNMAEDDTVEEQ